MSSSTKITLPDLKVLLDLDHKALSHFCAFLFSWYDLSEPNLAKAFKSSITEQGSYVLGPILKTISTRNPNFNAFLENPFLFFHEESSDYLLKWVLNNTSSFVKYHAVSTDIENALPPIITPCVHKLLEHATKIPNIPKPYQPSKITETQIRILNTHPKFKDLLKNTTSIASELICPYLLSPSFKDYIPSKIRTHVLSQTISHLCLLGIVYNNSDLLPQFLSGDKEFNKTFNNLLNHAKKNDPLDDYTTRTLYKYALQFCLTYKDTITLLSKNSSKEITPDLSKPISKHLAPLFDTGLFSPTSLPVKKQISKLISTEPKVGAKVQTYLSKQQFSDPDKHYTSSVIDTINTLIKYNVIQTPQFILKEWNNSCKSFKSDSEIITCLLLLDFTPIPDSSAYVNSIVSSAYKKKLSVTLFMYLIYRKFYFSKDCFAYITSNFSHHDAAFLTLYVDECNDKSSTTK